MHREDANRDAPSERGGGVVLARRHRGKVATPETAITSVRPPSRLFTPGTDFEVKARNNNDYIRTGRWGFWVGCGQPVYCIQWWKFYYWGNYNAFFLFYYNWVNVDAVLRLKRRSRVQQVWLQDWCDGFFSNTRNKNPADFLNLCQRKSSDRLSSTYSAILNFRLVLNKQGFPILSHLHIECKPSDWFGNSNTTILVKQRKFCRSINDPLPMNFRHVYLYSVGALNQADYSWIFSLS